MLIGFLFFFLLALVSWIPRLNDPFCEMDKECVLRWDGSGFWVQLLSVSHSRDLGVSTMEYTYESYSSASRPIGEMPVPDKGDHAWDLTLYFTICGS